MALTINRTTGVSGSTLGGLGKNINTTSKLKDNAKKISSVVSSNAQKLRDDYLKSQPDKTYYGDTGNTGTDTGYSTHEVRTTTDDYVNLLKSLWNQQKEASDAYAKTQYEQYLNEIAQNTEALKNRANLDMAFTDRKIGQRYGGGVYGKGLSQRSRNISNWGNKLADIRRDDATSRNNAFASYNASLANNASTLANAYVNTILPIWTDRQRYLDSLAFNNSHQV